MTYRDLLGLSLASGTFVVWACGGSTGTPNGAGSDGGSSSGASASGSGSSSGTSAGSGSGSTGDDGGGSGSGSGGGSSGSSSGASSSGSTTDGGQTVPGNQFNCGTTVANAMPCTPPDVCCEARGMGGAETATCEAESACTAGVATGCDVGSCPSGAVCCATITIGTAGESGSTSCVVGSCSGGALQLCSTMNPCPAGERCVAAGAGGGNEVCRAIPDGGGFNFDAGHPIFDAAGTD